MFRIGAVVFREILEISLLLGVLVAVTTKIRNSKLYIIAGVILGVVCASFFAFFAQEVSVAFSGVGDEIFDSSVILLTVLVICLTVIWMQDYAKHITKNFKNLSSRIQNGKIGRFVIVSVSATTVFREAIEIMLYLYGISSLEYMDMNDYLVGFAIGTGLGVIMGVLLYLGLIRFTKQYIFTISAVILVFVAAGLAAEAAGILTSAGIIDTYVDILWDIGTLLDGKTIAGRIAATILGCIAKPNGMQLIFYFGTMALILFMMWFRGICCHSKR